MTAGQLSDFVQLLGYFLGLVLVWLHVVLALVLSLVWFALVYWLGRLKD